MTIYLVFHLPLDDYAIVKNSMYEELKILYNKHCVMTEKAGSNIYRG